MQACGLQGNSLIICAGPSSYEQGVHRLEMYKAKYAPGQFTCKYSSSTLLNHGVNALNTSGALPAVWFAGLSVLTLPKSAPKSLCRLCPKHKRCFGEQNAKLPHKSNFWVITKTTGWEKISSSFKKYILYLYICFFFQCFMPQIGSKDVKCHLKKKLKQRTKTFPPKKTTKPNQTQKKQNQILSSRVQCLAATFPTHRWFLSFAYSAALKSEALQP